MVRPCRSRRYVRLTLAVILEETIHSDMETMRCDVAIACLEELRGFVIKHATQAHNHFTRLTSCCRLYVTPTEQL